MDLKEKTYEDSEAQSNIFGETHLPTNKVLSSFIFRKSCLRSLILATSFSITVLYVIAFEYLIACQ